MLFWVKATSHSDVFSFAFVLPYKLEVDAELKLVFNRDMIFNDVHNLYLIFFKPVPVS